MCWVKSNQLVLRVYMIRKSTEQMANRCLSEGQVFRAYCELNSLIFFLRHLLGKLAMAFQLHMSYTIAFQIYMHQSLLLRFSKASAAQLTLCRVPVISRDKSSVEVEP
jgi:hypothetical protein